MCPALGFPGRRFAIYTEAALALPGARPSGTREEDRMPAQTVCISRTHAALGEEIGTLVAEQLGFRYVDEQVIERAARLAQVDPKLVAKVEERQPLLQRLTEKLA